MVISLDQYRRLRALRDLAAAIGARLSTITCEQHGVPSKVVAEVCAELRVRIHFIGEPCCEQYAAVIRLVHEQLLAQGA